MTTSPKDTNGKNGKNENPEPHAYKKVAICFQGGGSLGAYHIGVYEALDEAGYRPDIFSGISIGSFTAAILAGNKPEVRLQRLIDFWDKISWPENTSAMASGNLVTKNKMSSMEGFQYGQPFFFTPRHPHPTLQPRGSIEATSYYDTTPLIETLEEFVDFEYLNAMHTQLLLGAVKVRTGELVFFNNRKEIMRAQHIMASGAMPPGFPGVRIHNELYWDGGIVSNTPLQGIYEARHPKDHVLTFMIDLFSATGDEPRDMDEVQMRMKDISYASRTAHHIKHLSRHHSLGHAFKNAIDDLPEEIKKNPIIREARKIENEAKFDIVHLVYSKPPHEISSSDCEFSKSSIAARRKQGYEDMKNILIKSPWLEVSHHGSRGFHFHKGDHRAI